MYNYEYRELRRFNKPFLVAFILLVFLGVGFGVYHAHESSTISIANTTISSLTHQLTSFNSETSSLGDRLAAANMQISSLKNQVTSDTTQISTLQSQLNAYKANLASSQNQLSTTSAQTASLQTQLNTANAQITSLQNQVASLTSQLQSLQTSSTGVSNQLVSSMTITQIHGAQSIVTSFTADTAGYLEISGYSTSSTGYIKVSYGDGTFDNYAFTAVNNTFSIPVNPGPIVLCFGNSNASGTVTATFTSIVYSH